MIGTIPKGSCQNMGHRAIGPRGPLRGAVGAAGARRGRFADWVTPGPVSRPTPFAPGGGSGERPAWWHHARMGLPRRRRSTEALSYDLT